jgi:FMN-dependent oxidoreductase (nitrilotriacetate monooxygenase family)
MSRLIRTMRLGLILAGADCHPARSGHPYVRADGVMEFKRLAHCAKVSEEGKLDFILLRGAAAVTNDHRPRNACSLKQDRVNLEPLTLAAALAAVTRHIGLVTAASTSLHHPFALARRLASIDHLSQGRAGWNVLTAATLDERLNHNLDETVGAEGCYERAREFLSVVQGLFDGWEPGAFLRDRATGVYMDPAKMHRLHHAGPHFKVRGPIDVDRPPQGALPIVCECTSDGDQGFAAEVADVVWDWQPSIENARAHYSSIKDRLAYCGRTSESLLMMASIMPIIGRTQTEAEDLFATLQSRLRTDVIDAPVPDAVSRESAHFAIVGTPTLIADTMEEWFVTGAADGFVIQLPYLSGGLGDLAYSVIPELQRRGLFRIDYEGDTLREHLGMTPVAAWKDVSAGSVN